MEVRLLSLTEFIFHLTFHNLMHWLMQNTNKRQIHLNPHNVLLLIVRGTVHRSTGTTKSNRRPVKVEGLIRVYFTLTNKEQLYLAAAFLFRWYVCTEGHTAEREKCIACNVTANLQVYKNVIKCKKKSCKSTIQCSNGNAEQCSNSSESRKASKEAWHV